MLINQQIYLYRLLFIINNDILLSKEVTSCMKLFFEYFLIFFIYSVIGWIVESTFVSLHEKKFVDRGFLIGPYCPIYGYGSLAMILYLEQYKSNIVTVFLLCVVICAILEYFTSYIMEILFKTRWWDYSNKKFNLNGRVCGENAILFGIGGILVLYFIQPFINKILSNISDQILLIISIITFIIFLTDTIVSLNIVKRFKKTITSIDLKKDSTQEFSKMVRETISSNHHIFQKRLMIAFPNINFQMVINTKNKIKGKLKGSLKHKEHK